MDWRALPSPCYIVDEGLLARNLELLRGVADAAGCRVLLAQKGFSMYAMYPLIAQYLSGAAASSLFEARLAAEEMRREVHIYSPAYRDGDFPEISKICSHIIFNSFGQWRRYRSAAGNAKCGIRVNPGYSEVEIEIYNPCAPGSRLGVTCDAFEREQDCLNGITGLHFHTMCEQNSDTLKRTLNVVREKFGSYLQRMEWVNFGGGHHITRHDYDLGTLIGCVRKFSDEFGVLVYLEPGEAIAMNTGFLVSTVLDIVDNAMNIAILDASAACHMPDVLEMPYRPGVIGATDPSAPGYDRRTHPYIYRLGGLTCLSGDVIGDYAFTQPLSPGDRLVFTDMAHYTMVKNNTFNGINLPSIMLNTKDGRIKKIRDFGYEDFKHRLS
ncbi:MAG: carboxynorspermidine decarboxylase [Oscillospiraceae bacterium]|nr:carboxynorspermidine decarboxylase [Oscillospiraceae bacterium]